MLLAFTSILTAADKNPGDEQARATFEKVAHAYEVRGFAAVRFWYTC